MKSLSLMDLSDARRLAKHATVDVKIDPKEPQRPSLVDTERFLSLVSSMESLEDRVACAFRGAAWAHGMALWHLTRVSFSPRFSYLEALASNEWTYVSVLLSTHAALLPVPEDRFLDQFTLLLFGMAAGIALCIFLQICMIL